MYLQESNVLKSNNIALTRELHKLQAHLLYYQQLLRDFRVSVEFVKDTPNPAMSVLESNPSERRASAELLCKEANNLVSEIDRLTGQRQMLSDRLQNVIHLVRIRCPFSYSPHSSHPFSRHLRVLILRTAKLCRSWH